jgi:hypothetical protein
MARLRRFLLSVALLGGVELPSASVAQETDDAWDAVMRWTPPAQAAGEANEAKPKSTKRRAAIAKAGRKKTKRKSTQGLTAGYQTLKESWHEPAPEPEKSDRAATLVPALTFRVVGMSEPIVLVAQSDQGGFGPEALELAGQAFRSWEGGPQVSERLLNLIYQATRYFEAPHVHLISGVRKDRGASRHTHGLAADIVLPGVKDEELASYFRVQGFVGVGVYTKAGFVHVDTREKSFFWIDPSPPGKRMKIRPILADQAAEADRAALERGAQAWVNPPRLDRALAKRNAHKRKQARERASGHKASTKLASQHERAHGRGASTQ